MKRPIAISLSPNAERDDVLLALKILFSPIRWFNFRETEKLESEFARLFGREYHTLAVNSGRGALYLILKALGIKEDDEVAVQALTCVAVPNSVIWLKAKPLYVDVNNFFNMDPKDLSEKLSEKTKAIIVQHSFGIPAEMDVILKIARKRKIPVIEDCALALGGRYKNRKLGILGDVSFFSFGRDKVISSVFGGMILCKDKKLYKKLLDIRDSLGYPGPLWVIQQLLHPPLFSLILSLYNLGLGRVTIGKILLFLFQKFGILTKAVYWEEELGKKPKVFPTKLPGGLSVLAVNQLKKLERFNRHRIDVANLYSRRLKGRAYKFSPERAGAIWVRFPVIHEDAGKIFKFLKKKGVLLGDWYKAVVVPVKNLSLVDYKVGSCPKAEELAAKIINLPTYPTMSMEDAERVIQLIKSCQN